MHHLHYIAVNAKTCMCYWGERSEPRIGVLPTLLVYVYAKCRKCVTMFCFNNFYQPEGAQRAIGWLPG